MHLTKSQKKYIKKNLKRREFSEIAKKIGIPEKELLDYLKIKRPSLVASSDQKPFQWEGFIVFFKKNIGIIIFFALLVFGVYANCLKNEFLSDDIAGIMQEKNIGNPFYFLIHQPINFFRYLNYAIVYNIFGLNPFFFRLTNVFIHLGSVIILFTALSLLYDRRVAIFVSGIFTVHPLLSEAVTWITGGGHAQYVFFDLLAFLLYLLARFHNWSKKYYLLSLTSFFIALFTTEKSAILPLIIISFEFSFGDLKKTWKKTIPYFLLSGFAAIFVIFGGNFTSRINALHNQYYQEQGLYNPLTQIPTAIFSYLQLMVWPDKLTLYHSEMAFSNFQYLIMLLTTCILFGLLIISFLKKNLRKYFFWLSFFLISLLPMLTPFKIAWIVAERYVYFGSIGIFVLFGLFLQYIGGKSKNKFLPWGIWIILIITLSTRTITRNIDWKNQDNLWVAAARTSPSSPQNHNNLGDMYGRHGDLPKAVEEFQAAIRLKPDYGDAYHNLANIYRLMGKNDLAAENYQKAIYFNPNLWQSYQNLSVILFESGRLEQSVSSINKAIEINPRSPDLRVILGYIFMNAGNKEAAKNEFLKALELDPNNQNAINFLKNIR